MYRLTTLVEMRVASAGSGTAEDTEEGRVEGALILAGELLKLAYVEQHRAAVAALLDLDTTEGLCHHVATALSTLVKV